MLRFSISQELDFLNNVKVAEKKAQSLLDLTVLRDSNYFVPQDNSFLQDSGILFSDIGKGSVGWNTPYARRLYYNPQYNFAHDKNPNAKGLWFEEAKSLHLNDWLMKTQIEYLRYFRGEGGS